MEKAGYPPRLNHLLLKRLVKKELPKGLWIPRDVLYSIDIQPTIWELLEFHKEILARLDRIEEKIGKKKYKEREKMTTIIYPSGQEINISPMKHFMRWTY